MDIGSRRAGRGVGSVSKLLNAASSMPMVLSHLLGNRLCISDSRTSPSARNRSESVSEGAGFYARMHNDEYMRVSFCTRPSSVPVSELNIRKNALCKEMLAWFDDNAASGISVDKGNIGLTYFAMTSWNAADGTSSGL